MIYAAYCTQNLDFVELHPNQISSGGLCPQGDAWLTQHADILDDLATARSPEDLAQAVADVESMLHEGGVLLPEWGADRRQHWRSSLLSAEEAATVLMHVASLQVS